MSGLLVVCDTDFLIKISNDPLPKLDWKTLSSSYEFVTLPSVARELDGLYSRPRGRTAKRAGNALRILSSGKIRVLRQRSEADADYALLDFVRERPTERVLATLDGTLLSMLEKNGLGYFTLSSNKPLIRRAETIRNE